MEAVLKSVSLKLFLQAFGYVTPIIVLGRFSVDIYGDYVVQTTYALLTSTLLGLSLGNTHIVFDNKSSYKLLLCSSVFLFTILLLAGVYTGLIWLAAAAVFSLQKFNNAFLRDKRHITKFYAFQIVERLLFLVLVFASGNSWLINLSLMTFYVIASLIITVPVFLILSMRTYGRYLSVSGLTSLKELMLWSIRGHIGVAVQKINTKLDLLLLSWFLSSAVVGYYNILISLSVLVWTLPDALNSFLLKELVKAPYERKVLLIKMYTRWVLLVVIGCLILYTFGGSVILSMYSGFPDGFAWMLVVLTIGTGFFALAKPRVRFFTSMNKPEIGSQVAILGLINTLIVAPLCIWQAGISGAVVASSLGYIVSALHVLRKPMIAI